MYSRTPSMSIDGKKSIFSEGALIFTKFCSKNGQKRILLKYSGKIHTFLIKSFEPSVSISSEVQL